MKQNTKCKHCEKDIKGDWKLCPWCGWTVVKESDKVSGITLIIGERKKIRDAAGTIAGFRAVRDVYVVTGEGDILIKATAPTFEELRAFIVDSVGGVDGVVDTRTYMIVNSYKELKDNLPDPGKDPVRTIILLKVDQSMKKELAEALIKQDTIEDVLQVTGDADLVVKCLFPNYPAMKKFISETIGGMPGVKEQKTFMAMTIFKEHGEATEEAPEASPIPDDVYFRHPKDETEVMQILTNLPRGVPSSLWGFEIDELATEILNAEYAMTSKGAPILKIKNKWYRGDIDDISSYLRSYDDVVLKPKK
jgi:DNA-binding Lrp family transcriptional regulator